VFLKNLRKLGFLKWVSTALLSTDLVKEGHLTQLNSYFDIRAVKNLRFLKKFLGF